MSLAHHVSASSRGEMEFARLPGFAAWLYDWLLRIGPVETQTRAIARELAARVRAGRILDIGTGPGRLLLELHRLNGDLDLFGLDIAASMVRQARRNLKGISVDLRRGSIRNTDYEGGYFDAVTSVGSFYLWDEPAACVDEIFRILKTRCSAYLFETYRDYDAAEFQRELAANLATVDPCRRVVSRLALAKQLRITYRTDEFARILDGTRFAGHYALAKVRLACLPIWLEITLTKVAEAPTGRGGSAVERK